MKIKDGVEEKAPLSLVITFICAVINPVTSLVSSLKEYSINNVVKKVANGQHLAETLWKRSSSLMDTFGKDTPG